MIGQNIAHYKVTAKLGEGGMGEVYRATDTKLGRDVALKVLPEAFASDTQRMQRFQREAQVLASLNHPNIGTIHGLEELGATHALVMELVEGPTLAERIAQGAVPLEEALPIAKQIAEALEYAHSHGIIHRDLKPANIKLTTDGQVKVLDFGLAKALSDESSAQDISNSPTLSMAATKAGIILGTAAYMSPEQARGAVVDKRADIWSFGVVLFEMLTGRRLFAGDTASDTLAAVLKLEPEWNALPAQIPVAVRRLLRRSLEKNRKQRLHDIADARLEIEEALTEPVDQAISVGEPAPRPLRRGLPWALVVVFAMSTLVLAWQFARSPREGPAEAPATRSTLPLAVEFAFGGWTGSNLALSPQGTDLVFSGIRDGKRQLYLRKLNELEASPIPGTEGGHTPFFAPGGGRIGFFDQNWLKTLDLGTGLVANLCRALGSIGANWGADEIIRLTSGSAAGIYEVPARGGECKVVARPDFERGERSYRVSDTLPGGKGLLFTLVQSGADLAITYSVALRDSATGQHRVLLKGGSSARYAPSGHLVFSLEAKLYAVPFDLASLKVTGEPVPVVENVLGDRERVHFSLSSNGILATVPGGLRESQSSLQWMDRQGRARPVSIALGNYSQPAFSPDGRRLAVIGGHYQGSDIWVHDFSRGTFTRLTTNPTDDESPVWTPDGRRITFSSNRAGVMDLYEIPADGSAPEKSVLVRPGAQMAQSWLPDGKVLLFLEGPAAAPGNLWVMTREGSNAPLRAFLESPFKERCAQFSPDGRWVAYTSDESGRDEVYVRPFPAGSGKVQISVDGGDCSRWARNGRELFYQSGNKLMAVAVRPGAEFAADPPKALFEAPLRPDPTANLPDFDVSPDGQRFIIVRPEKEAGPTQIHLLANWTQELKRRGATGKQ